MPNLPSRGHVSAANARIEPGDIDPGFVVTNQTPLKKAPRMYQKFRKKQDCVIKVVLHPAT